MRYLLFSFIIFCASFALAFFASIVKKRFAFLALILSYIGIQLALMYKFDVTYLTNLIGNIHNFLVYLFISSCIVLIISILEIIFMKNKRKGKNSSKEKTVYLERDTKLYYFNLINLDIAYYNVSKEKYILNNSFRKTLKIENIEVAENEFLNYVLDEDKNIFSSNKEKVQIRLKVDDVYQWYMLTQELIGGEIYKLIYKIDNKITDATIGTYKELDKILKEYEQNNTKFGLILSNINSISEEVVKLKSSMSKSDLRTLKEVKDKELRDIIIVKYLAFMLNGDFKDNIHIYKISTNEYAFLLEGKQTYGMVERELFNNNSSFLNANIEIGDKTYIIKFKIACVYSEYVKVRDNYHVINAAFDMLQLAFSNKKEFSIYQNQYDEEEVDLKKLGIDLDNDIKRYL